ncbi:MAG: hypothetical protein IK020_01010 [Clostridiales bacterium]|nr:hypothetical protein [Clostridiales bacterium]
MSDATNTSETSQSEKTTSSNSTTTTTTGSTSQAKTTQQDSQEETPGNSTTTTKPASETPVSSETPQTNETSQQDTTPSSSSEDTTTPEPTETTPAPTTPEPTTEYCIDFTGKTNYNHCYINSTEGVVGMVKAGTKVTVKIQIKDEYKDKYNCYLAVNGETSYTFTVNSDMTFKIVTEEIQAPTQPAEPDYRTGTVKVTYDTNAEPGVWKVKEFYNIPVCCSSGPNSDPRAYQVIESAKFENEVLAFLRGEGYIGYNAACIALD